MRRNVDWEMSPRDVKEAAARAYDRWMKADTRLDLDEWCEQYVARAAVRKIRCWLRHRASMKSRAERMALLTIAAELVPSRRYPRSWEETPDSGA